jgi:hypothetical protein
MDTSERVRLDFVGEEDLGDSIEVDERLPGRIRHFLSSRGGLLQPWDIRAATTRAALCSPGNSSL